MRRLGSIPFSIPDFRGASRALVLVNLIAFFFVKLAPLVVPAAARWFGYLLFDPEAFLHGMVWQPLTYSLLHQGILQTLLELLSIWFLAGFLESNHGANWVIGLYTASVLGTAFAATLLFVVCEAFGFPLQAAPLYGCWGGIFGMLMVIGVLHGDVEFMMFFAIGIKARYMAIIYALIALYQLFGDERLYAFAQLGGALVGLIYVRWLPRRGMGYLVSERWYGLQNRYYRWKRRRAARKFEVYMRKHGRTVRFDGQGRIIDEDQDDKKRWN
jgi:membrane associated rhomboid family serine protease